MPVRKIAIIGAGFSGLLTAIHLLKSPQVHVVLIERTSSFAAGTAYATGNPEHLLNVRLGNMSAFPDWPDHLLEWLATHSQWTVQDGFITRGVYGEYLRSLLADAMADGDTGPRLRLLQGEAVDLARAKGGWTIALADGGRVEADSVVLALGNIEPLTPPGVDPALEESWRYVGDPWRAAADLPEAARRVLLIGSGLTMVDAALSLRAPGRRLVAISRRGLLPRTHGHVPAAPDAEPYSGDPVAVLRTARRHARTRDWREVIDAVRWSARDLWRDWSPKQRASILRHLRPHWDVHRHRLSPAVAQRVHEMIASGELTVMAGRIAGLTLGQDRIRLAWRPRGARRLATRTVDAVVNCTGPLGDISQSRSTLIRGMLERGLVMPDPHGLGIRVDDRCRARDAHGDAVPGLHVVGPLTRGAFWEITSVPDLRVQGAEAARSILQP